MSPPVARNDPCPCGSGKRYKDCHGNFEVAAAKLLAGGPPSQADSLHREGAADMQRGDLRNALLKLSRAAQLAPGDGNILKSLARAQLAMQMSEASPTAQQAARLLPGDPEAWNVLGLALEKPDPEQALAAWRKAIVLAPRNPEAHVRIGDFQRRRGRPDDAVAAYRAALACGLDHPVLHNNLGLALQATGQLPAAEECFRRALRIHPAMVEAKANLGDALFRQHRFREAIPLLTEVLATHPGHASLWSALGTCQYRSGLISSAESSFQRALALNPDDPAALVNMASLECAHQRNTQAGALLQRALARAPELAEAQNMLLYVKQQQCDWPGMADLFEKQRARLAARSGPPVVPHNLLALPYSPAELLDASRYWVEARIQPPKVAPPAVARREGQRLRIGYLGSDFRAHPLANLLTEVIERHDRSRFDVFAYSFGPDDRSPERARFAQAFEHFVDVTGETFAQTAQRIRGDGITVLFDTGGHVLYARNEIFALRPAPIQINAIGFPGTLGADYFDYIVTDRFVTPPADQAHYSERFLYLPHCYLPGDSRRPVGSTPSREACGLPRDAFVFCCFNSGYKITDEIFAAWMRILAGTPLSVLWLLAPDEATQANLRREAEGRGIAPERVIFAPRVELAAHLARHALADLFLDTYPCNAHTTSNDALFVGLPVLTLAGETFASRVSGSQLHAIGLPELITHTVAEYEARALELARDRGRLAGYRQHLVDNRISSPLFDSAAYAQALEAALLDAVRRREQGLDQR
jgi:predicted O-linked N-acetylglucosamine transferase (SPINDLY family)